MLLLLLFNCFLVFSSTLQRRWKVCNIFIIQLMTRISRKSNRFWKYFVYFVSKLLIRWNSKMSYMDPIGEWLSIKFWIPSKSCSFYLIVTKLGIHVVYQSKILYSVKVWAIWTQKWRSHYLVNLFCWKMYSITYAKSI